MSDDLNTTTDETTGDTKNAKQMRERMQALEDTNKTLSARVKLSAFKEAGLDPEKGIGKAVYRTYEGDVDPEAIREFATTEYDWKPVATISDGQQRIQTLTQAGSAGEQRKTRIDTANEAAESGDWVKSARLKDAALFALTEKRNSF
jgi:hypothetical protein